MSAPADTKKRSIDDLVSIMAALRTPRTGCPWDLQQTFATIAPYTIEEAYEVADAIERGSLEDLREELGDLLLQVVYHARMAEEEEAFSFADVVEAICAKMIRRHPHVFGDEAVRAQIDTKGLWERIKAEERAEKGGARSSGEKSAEQDEIDAGIPLALPALSRAVKLQDRAARTGFDWPDTGPVLAKLREELDELEDEIAQEGDDAARREQIAEEYGDVMFVMANLARHLDIDPEAALRRANAKFVRRFSRMKALMEEAGKPMEEASLEEMDGFWDRAKAEERE
ncbi:MAG: nucleoside triphosphate pyrophosphohydrolase [Methyloligellaceae bacterium]